MEDKRDNNNNINTTNAKQCEPKFKGRASEKLVGPKAQQVWPFLADFGNLNKWFPTLKTCVIVEGESGQPGCVRYCAGFKTHISHSDPNHVNWTKQKLLSINHDEMELSYSIVDGNVGFNSYVSSVRVLSMDDGCVIEWDYEVEPPIGWELEDLDRFIGGGLKGMAQRIRDTLEVSQC